MLVTENQYPDLYESILEKNLVRQYDLLTNFIDIGVEQGPQAMDKYMLWALNHVAVAGISQFGGRFRSEPIYVGNHIPPHFNQVPELMDRFVCFIHENWDNMTPTSLAAYGLWRLNWIHPFIEGNGRTARAICYYLLCTKFNGLIPGEKIIPELIRENRDEYVNALREADNHWHNGNLDLTRLDDYLASLLDQQLDSV